MKRLNASINCGSSDLADALVAMSAALATTRLILLVRYLTSSGLMANRTESLKSRELCEDVFDTGRFSHGEYFSSIGRCR